MTMEVMNLELWDRVGGRAVSDFTVRDASLYLKIEEGKYLGDIVLEVTKPWTNIKLMDLDLALATGYGEVIWLLRNLRFKDQDASLDLDTIICRFLCEFVDVLTD